MQKKAKQNQLLLVSAPGEAVVREQIEIFLLQKWSGVLVCGTRWKENTP